MQFSLIELKKIKGDSQDVLYKNVQKITELKEQNQKEVRAHYASLRESLTNLENKICSTIDKRSQALIDQT